jgi:hypothetical protein
LFFEKSLIYSIDSLSLPKPSNCFQLFFFGLGDQNFFFAKTQFLIQKRGPEPRPKTSWANFCTNFQNNFDNK